MIDIDASLAAIESHQTFWVEFSNPEDKEEKLSFEVKADPRKQRKIIDAGTHVGTIIGDAQTMTISVDWMSIALSLSDYFVGWSGFQGEFNKEKAKKWLGAFVSYALSFAQNFKAVLDKYEADMVRRKDIEIKN
jgi:hypothetical protein